jgi:MFS family permease
MISGMADEEVSRPINWPREWLHDEKFWREVATRTVAGIIAGIVLAALAALVALRLTPLTGDAAKIASGVLIGTTLLGAIAGGVPAVFSIVRFVQKGLNPFWPIFSLVFFVVAIVGISISAVMFSNSL